MTEVNPERFPLRRRELAASAAVVVAGAAIYHLGLARAAGIPADVPLVYAGRLTDGGTAVEGTRRIGVSLYASDDATSPVCQAASSDTAVTDGYFRRAFPASCRQAVIDDATDLHVEIFVDGVSLGGKVRVGAVPYAVESVSAGNGVPVGGVIDWWRPAGSTALPPPGFSICDGSLVDDPESPFDDQNLPDLRGVFVRGAASVADIGTTGGAATHDHAVSMNVDPPSTTSSSDGNHRHLWSQFIGGSGTWHSGQSDGQWIAIADYGDGMDGTAPGNGAFPLASDNGTVAVSRDIYTGTPVATATGTAAPTHSHIIDTASFVASTTSAAGSSEPPYYGLLKIIRIK